MITATTILATTITVMARRLFALTVTIRTPLTHAPHMDTGDQITSLTVYLSAPDLGTVGAGAVATTGGVITGAVDAMAGAGTAGEATTDVEVTAATAVIMGMADTAVAGGTAVALILQEDIAGTAAGMAAVDTGVAAILQEDVADMAAADAGTVVAVDVADINPVEAVSMGVEEDSVAGVEEAVSTVAVDRTAAVVDRTAAVADTKSAISLSLEERLAIPASLLCIGSPMNISANGSYRSEVLPCDMVIRSLT